MLIVVFLALAIVFLFVPWTVKQSRRDVDLKQARRDRILSIGSEDEDDEDDNGAMAGKSPLVPIDVRQVRPSKSDQEMNPYRPPDDRMQ